MFPALFLDRDGVLIEYRPNYVRTWEDVVIYPSSIAALVKVKDTPYKIILVTNQSAVGRGIISLETALNINRHLELEIIKAGGRIDGIFMCPHTPKENCACRKPKPGLILQAAQALNLDLPQSILVGDALSDLEAGQAASIGQLALVRTGRGAQEEHLLPKPTKTNFVIFDDLAEVVSQLILRPHPSS